jgi:hypothetical protein
MMNEALDSLTVVYHLLVRKQSSEMSTLQQVATCTICYQDFEMSKLQSCQFYLNVVLSKSVFHETILQ